jgi:MOSC domain-containing protein YiiM
MAKVVEICSRMKARAPMVVYTSARVSFDHGVGDDSRGLIKGDRQVTVMTKEGWEAACEDLGIRLHWTTRRANLLIEGLDLENSTGDILKIGSFYLEITGELTPCERMDEECVGLKKALTPNWRGGVTCKIISEGMVSENDVVSLMERE